MQHRGYYEQFGGAYLPEILVATFDELENAFNSVKDDLAFWKEYADIMSTYSCRPTPLTLADNLTRHFGGARIYIKREDLNHTGAHKANNVMGQGLLVKRMGKKRVIAETGAGQHGVATATMAAKFGFACTIYMGEIDVERQRPNVFWMERLGAEVIPVREGSRILKDAINEAFRDWVSHMDTTHYVLGTACGPHPFPEMVTCFQSVIGKEIKKQVLEREGRLPKRLYACVGGGRMPWACLTIFWRIRWIWWGLKRPAGGLRPAGMPHDCQVAMPASGLPRDTKLIFSRTGTGRCGRPTVLPPGLIMWVFLPSWPI